MILSPGEKVHVIARRTFETDRRRHFAGVVQTMQGSLARVEGYAFILEPSRNEFVRLPERRTRIVALGDGRVILNVLPRDVEIESLRYEMGPAKRMVVTDGQGFELDVHEFIASR